VFGNYHLYLSKNSAKADLKYYKQGNSFEVNDTLVWSQILERRFRCLGEAVLGSLEMGQGLHADVN